MAADDIARRMREKRMAWLEIADGKKVRLIRPSEEQMGRGIVIGSGIAIGYDEVKKFAVEWSGFTEADMLGAAIGSSDAVPFHADLWAEYVTDNTDVYRQVAQKLLDMCLQHIEARAADRKN